MNIPVLIRGHPPPSSLVSQPSGVSDEQNPTPIKRPSRGRLPSITQSGVFSLNDHDNRSIVTVPGQETSKPISTAYRTFHLLRDSEYFRPKLSVDPIRNESESIEQINTLYMKGERKHRDCHPLF